MITIFTDTDSDISLKRANELGIKLISMPYSIDGELFFPCESWTEFDSHEFYTKLRNGVVPKTSSISEEKYIQYFEPVLASGSDVFYIHFSRNFSKTFGAMEQAIEKLKEKYPERKIWTVDTKAISIGQLNIVEEACGLFADGKSPEEVKAWIEEEAGHFALYFFTDGLKFLKQSGRVSGLSGAVGMLLGIRPIIYLSDDGRLLNIGKEKGRYKAIERIREYLKELGDEVGKHKIIITTSDNDELAKEMREMVVGVFGENVNIEMMSVGPVIGAHCGPDAAGVCFYAKHR